jgi:probable F420-dependent oxidoreductase
MLPRPEENPDASGFASFITLAQTIERAGLHAVSASDHPFPLILDDHKGHQTYDPFVLHSFIGAETTTLDLHFSLLVTPYRNPFLTARMLGTLDFATNGRVIAGLGAGYLEGEFEALGADFKGRGKNVTEVVDAMQAAWSGEPIELSGPNWRASGNTMLPVPASKPHPRLWRGGNTAKAISQVVRSFDGWSPVEMDEEGSRQITSSEMSLTTLPAHMKALREAIELAGRLEPVDVCYVRVARKWLKEPSIVIEHLQELDAQGVTWLEFNILGKNLAGWMESAESFAALAREAGVLTA